VWSNLAVDYRPTPAAAAAAARRVQPCKLKLLLTRSFVAEVSVQPLALAVAVC
jgi:hypothetical protein